MLWNFTVVFYQLYDNSLVSKMTSHLLLYNHNPQSLNRLLKEIHASRVGQDIVNPWGFRFQRT